ncbi:hypothetical protein J6590_088139 [Homalodisca vitripennis]|nr:hypothetical protein J6590_088139 [Homalodisca vitripennis]
MDLASELKDAIKTLPEIILVHSNDVSEEIRSPCLITHTREVHFIRHLQFSPNCYDRKGPLQNKTGEMYLFPNYYEVYLLPMRGKHDGTTVRDEAADHIKQRYGNEGPRHLAACVSTNVAYTVP